MTLTANVVLGLVHTVFKFGGAAMKRRELNKALKPIAFLPQPLPMKNPREFTERRLEDPRFQDGGEFAGLRAQYADIITTSAMTGRIQIPLEAELWRVEDLCDDVIDLFAVEWEGEGNPPGVRSGRQYHYEISSSEGISRKQSLATMIVSAAEAGLILLNYKADALGLSNRAEEVVGACALGIRNFVSTAGDDIADAIVTGGSHKLIGEALVATALNVAHERPELVSKKENVQFLVKSVMGPLRELNQSEGARELSVTQRVDRVKDALRGPVAIGVLEALHAKRAEFFGIGDNELAGKAAASPMEAVTEAMMGMFVSDAAELQDVREIFTPAFVARSYPKVLDVVAASPAAFVRGKGAGVALSQDLLAGFATAFSHNARQVRKDPELARSLFELGVDITRRHARTYLADKARGAVSEWADARHARAEQEKDDPWAVVGVQLVAHLADKVLDVFEPMEGELRSLDDAVAQSVAGVLKRETVLELVGLVADRAAETPGMILPDGASPEVVAIAEGVASFIATEHSTLLSTKDWRRVSAHAVELAMKNPDTLFRLDATQPGDQLATTLITSLLAHAHASMSNGENQAERARGRVMFGQTLADAMSATLEAAVSNTQRLRAPETLTDLSRFIETLNQMAAGSTALGGRGLSSDDWAYAFRWFVSDVVSGAGTAVTEARIGEIVTTAERRSERRSERKTERHPAQKPQTSPTPPASPPSAPSHSVDQAGDWDYQPAPTEGALG